MGHPYITSLWLGSLALKCLSLNGVLHCSLALLCLLPSYFQAFEKSVNKGFKRSLCYFTRPFSCLNGVNAIQGILSCISWIPSKYCKHKYSQIMNKLQFSIALEQCNIILQNYLKISLGKPLARVPSKRELFRGYLTI